MCEKSRRASYVMLRSPSTWLRIDSATKHLGRGHLPSPQILRIAQNDISHTLQEMLIVVMNHRIGIGPNQMLFVLSLGLAGSMLAWSSFGAIPVILLLGLIYLLLRFTNKPLSRFIARLAFSIRSACFLAAPACAYTRWGL